MDREFPGDNETIQFMFNIYFQEEENLFLQQLVKNLRQ